MSHIVKAVNSVNIHSFEPGQQQLPVNLNATQANSLKQELHPLYNALIQHTVFKKTFAQDLSSTSSEIPINISLTETTITVTNKDTGNTSKFSISQDPTNATLNEIITRIFKIAKNALPKSSTEPKTPHKQIVTQQTVKTPQPDLLDVSQLSDPIALVAPKNEKNDPFNDFLIPPSSDSHSTATTQTTTLPLILNLYHTTPSELIPKALFPKLPNPDLRKPQYHFDGTTPKSKKPYLEDLFYDLPHTFPKKSEIETFPTPEKRNCLSDLDAFTYLKDMERLETQKKLTLEADLTLSKKDIQ